MEKTKDRIATNGVLLEPQGDASSNPFPLPDVVERVPTALTLRLLRLKAMQVRGAYRGRYMINLASLLDATADAWEKDKKVAQYAINDMGRMQAHAEALERAQFISQFMVGTLEDRIEALEKIVEARPDDLYPDEDMGLSDEAKQWVQEIWRTARIHQAAVIKANRRIYDAIRIARDSEGRWSDGTIASMLATLEGKKP